VDNHTLFQFVLKKDLEIAPRPSTGSGRSEPAELRRRGGRRVNEFFIQKFSELWNSAPLRSVEPAGLKDESLDKIYLPER
jgi:hypothetical protein